MYIEPHIGSLVSFSDISKPNRCVFMFGIVLDKVTTDVYGKPRVDVRVMWSSGLVKTYPNTQFNSNNDRQRGVEYNVEAL